MPTYEYECETCGTVFELRQKFADAPLTVHEGCGGSVHRLLSAPALQFKGTGWYITDYGKGNSGKAGHSDSKSASGDSSKAESKSGSSSESKSESKPKTDAPAAASTSSSSSTKKD